MSREPRFRKFVVEHRELDQLFVDHQVALTALDLNRAGERLREFDRRVADRGFLAVFRVEV